MAKKKAYKVWLPTPQRAAKPKVPEAEKQKVEAECQAFIEKMKLKWVQPPADTWGYVHDIYGKWYRHYFYFCATYRYNSPIAIEPEREIKHARLEYVSSDSFHLSYFRHTGSWWEVFSNLSLNDCLQQIEENQLFWP